MCLSRKKNTGLKYRSGIFAIWLSANMRSSLADLQSITRTIFDQLENCQFMFSTNCEGHTEHTIWSQYRQHANNSRGRIGKTADILYKERVRKTEHRPLTNRVIYLATENCIGPKTRNPLNETAHIQKAYFAHNRQNNNIKKTHKHQVIKAESHKCKQCLCVCVWERGGGTLPFLLSECA